MRCLRATQIVILSWPSRRQRRASAISTMTISCTHCKHGRRAFFRAASVQGLGKTSKCGASKQQRASAHAQHVRTAAVPCHNDMASHVVRQLGCCITVALPLNMHVADLQQGQDAMILK